MTLMPVDGILEVVAKVADVDQDAAAELVRLGLYEATCDQIDAMAPRLARDQAETVIKRCAVGRQALYRMAETVVSKAESDSLARQLEYLDQVEAQAMQQLVSKGRILDWLGWNQENPNNPRNRLGRYAEAEGGEGGEEPSKWRKPGPEDTRRGLYDVLEGVSERGASRMAYALPTGEGGKARNQNQNAARWNATGEGRDRSYRRLTMTGEALRQVSAPGSGAHTVGSLARLVGDLGPEAEKVLGPGIRRTAYRYRGTEKRPDPDLIGHVQPGTGARMPGAVGRVNESLGKISGSDVAQSDQELARLRDAVLPATTGRKRELDPAEAIVARHLGARDLSPDQVKMRARGDVVADYLIKKLPSPEMTAISIKAGEVPPSQGVIIDADGNVLSEAQGFNGDHYLPFDLKNLRGLRGGQYIRTRATGGPTTEDIYTGLLTGARQVQVVSNSGVFTVEFDPSLRGGRRYSDKARRMIGRYERLLDTMHAGGMYRVDVPEAEKREMKRQAYKDQDWNTKAGEEVFTQMLEAKRAELAFGLEDDELEEAAEERVTEDERTGKPYGSAQERARAKDDWLRTLKDENRDTAVRQYQLDGQGYAAALTALAQEFPYYLRPPVFEPLPEFLETRGMPTGGRKRRAGPDKGYVEHGELHATGVGSGFHSTVARGNRLTGGAAAAAAATAANEAEEAEQGTGAGPAAAKKPAVSPAKAKVKIQPHPDTVPFDEVIAAGSPASKALAKALRGSVYVLNKIPLGEDDESLGNAEEDVLQAPAVAYAKWRIGKTKDPSELANWLLHDANPEQREKFLEGVADAAVLAHETQGESARILFPDIDKSVETVEKIAQLAGGFAPSMPANPAMAEPSVRDPRPLPFDEIMALGNVLENYEKYEANAKTQVPHLGEMIDKLGTMSTNQIVDGIAQDIANIEEMTDASKRHIAERKLENVQQAWAFVKARELAGGAAPFGKAAAAPLSPFERALQLHLALLEH